MNSKYKYVVASCLIKHLAMKADMRVDN